MALKNAVGVDIEEISRFVKYSEDKNSAFVKRVYSEAEIEYCYSKRLPAPHLAARFCAKEAVFKALSSLEFESPLFKEIEILNKETGVPYVFINNEKYNNLTFQISLSHCKSNAIAFVEIMLKD
ncbi:MAG: holo-ACP synthase [Candidatus Gastranaerophilales bacterium]|nr:holo-ACP synthase [Candidatus Gastranaerophilales bacterium]